MKRTLSLTALLMAVLLLFGCAGKKANPDVVTGTFPEEETQAITETATQAEETTKVRSDKTIDYESAELTDLRYDKENANHIEQRILDLSYIEYGVPGSSLSIDSRAITLLNLSNDKRTVKTIDSLLNEMNPLQKDFFSYAWDITYSNARDVLKDSKDFKERVDINFDMDFCPDDYSLESLGETDKEVQQIFEKYSITKEWEDNDAFFDLLD